uniref:Rpn family recombination-promoting nuclease/putative transposase n=1 Tax=Candidatus Electrothrix sp. TaxID=2170559 RepID=UPI00405734ED
SDDIRDREDDIVWRVRWGKSWIYIYLLLEFQSTVDHWMGVRMMTYVGLLYQDLIRTGKLTKTKKLPPVFPIVLYNGKTCWNAATDLNELVEEIPGSLRRYQPSMSYLLLAEHNFRDQELQPLKNLVAALFRLEISQEPAHLAAVVENLLDWLKEPEQAYLRRAFTVWFHRVLFADKPVPKKIGPLNELSEVRVMLAERVQEWKKEWKKEAIQEGLREGLQKGLQKGKFSMLHQLLEYKFGTLEARIVEQLQAANDQQLEEWGKRILTATTLNDIFDN